MELDNITQDTVLGVVEAEVAHVDRAFVLTRFKPKAELEHDFNDVLDSLKEQRYA